MPGADTFYDTLAEYLTIRLGQASLGPAGTGIPVVTLAAALLSALHLWKIGKEEDRLDRLGALRGAPGDRTPRARRPPRDPPRRRTVPGLPARRAAPST